MDGILGHDHCVGRHEHWPIRRWESRLDHIRSGSPDSSHSNLAGSHKIVRHPFLAGSRLGSRCRALSTGAVIGRRITPVLDAADFEPEDRAWLHTALERRLAGGGSAIPGIDTLLVDIITIIGHIGCYIACDITRENSSDSCYQGLDAE